jgi:hypothetical protein
MMATRPLRRITLHFSHIFFTEALTFITTLPWAFWASRTRDFALSVSFRLVLENTDLDKKSIVHQSLIL